MACCSLTTYGYCLSLGIGAIAVFSQVKTTKPTHSTTRIQNETTTNHNRSLGAGGVSSVIYPV